MAREKKAAKGLKRKFGKICRRRSTASTKEDKRLARLITDSGKDRAAAAYPVRARTPGTRADSPSRQAGAHLATLPFVSDQYGDARRAARRCSRRAGGSEWSRR